MTQPWHNQGGSIYIAVYFLFLGMFIICLLFSKLYRGKKSAEDGGDLRWGSDNLTIYPLPTDVIDPLTSSWRTICRHPLIVSVFVHLFIYCMAEMDSPLSA